MTVSLWRSRWAAVGAAIAVALAGGGLGIAHAVSSPAANPVTTLITPCRLLDTRVAPYGVGARHTPLAAGETFTASIAGCSIPQTATGIIANVTVVNPTDDSHLTVWPAGQARPNSSNLNWIAGQAPVANQVTTSLSADFRFSMFSPNGTVDVIVDITGYLAPADLSNYYTKAQVDAAVAAAASCKAFPHYSVDWHGCDVSGANLTKVTLAYANLAGLVALNANMADANVQSVNLTGANLVSINGTRINLNLANLTNAKMGSAYLSDAILTHANLTGVDLAAGTLTGSDLTGANLTGAALTGVDMTGANFTDANLTDAYFPGANSASVIWSNTTCPDATNSNNNGGTCAGHGIGL